MDPSSAFFGCLFIAMLVRFSVARCCCVPTECYACVSETTPSAVEVEFTGVVDGVFCSECDTFNTTLYVLPQEKRDPWGSLILGGAEGCEYFFDQVGLCSGNYCGITFDYKSQDVSNVRSFVRLVKLVGPYGSVGECRGLTGQYYEKNNLAKPYDCMTAQTGLTVTGSADGQCDFSGSTVDMTPV